MSDSTVWEILLGSIPTPVLLYSGWASKSNYISILPKIIGDQMMIFCVLFNLKIGIKIFNLFCTFNMCHCVTIFTRSDCTILHFQILLNRENNVFLKIFDKLVEFLPYFKKKKLKKFVECKDDVFGEPYIWRLQGFYQSILGTIHKWCHPLRGRGSTKRQRYSISPLSKMRDKGEGGIKNLKK